MDMLFASYLFDHSTTLEESTVMWTILLLIGSNIL